MDLNRQRYRVYIHCLREVKVGGKNKEILTGVWFPETIIIHALVLYAGVLCQLTQFGLLKWLVIWTRVMEGIRFSPMKYGL